MRQPASLSAGDTPGGGLSCVPSTSVPPSETVSLNLIVMSPHSGICGLELECLDHFLIRHEPDEAIVVCIGVRGRLADLSRRVVCQGDTKRTPFTGVKRMHATDHASRQLPFHDRARVEKRAIDLCTRRIYVANDACGGFGHKFNPLPPP